MKTTCDECGQRHEVKDMAVLFEITDEDVTYWYYCIKCNKGETK